MIEVELWDKEGLPLTYVQISAPLRELFVPVLDIDTLITGPAVPVPISNIKNRCFRFHGKSADLTDVGVSVRLVYKEV